MARELHDTFLQTIQGSKLVTDDALLSPFWKWLARSGAPIAAILIPATFFLSVVSPTATKPNSLINLAYLGALFLAAAVLSLGIGLIRAARQVE